MKKNTVRVRHRPDREHLQLAFTDPLTGRTLTKSAGSSKPKDAERAAAVWELELSQRSGLTTTGWDIFRSRFEDEHLETVGQGTAKQYMYALDRFAQIIGRPRDINLINGSTMSQFAAQLRKSGLSTDSVGSKLRHVKSALGWAAKIGMIQSAPNVSLPPRSGSRGRSLSLPEVIRFFQTIRQVVPVEHQTAMVTLIKILWLGGFRLAEALTVSFENPPIRIGLDDATPAIHWSCGGQKSKREEVTCLPPDLYRFLLKQRSSQPSSIQVIETDLSRRQIQNYLTLIGRQSGIMVSPTKHATAHDFRRTFGTRTALRVHPFVLKHLMRHKDIQTTMRYYLSLDSDEIGRQLWKNVQGHVHESGLSQLTPRGPTHKIPQKNVIRKPKKATR